MNDHKVIQGFKVLFIIGSFLLVISCFLEWYSFQYFDLDLNSESIFSYFPLFGMSLVKNQTGVNDIFTPNTFMPPYLQYIFIGIIVFSLFSFGVLNATSNQRIFSTFSSAVLLLNVYYLIIFPSIYLLQNDLYFPFLRLTEPNLNIRLTYSFGLGYYFQVLGFLLTFPLTLYSFQGPLTSKINNASTQKDTSINELIMLGKDNDTLNRLISEERAKLLNERTEGWM